MSEQTNPRSSSDTTTEDALNPSGESIKFESSDIGIKTAKAEDPFVKQKQQAAKRAAENQQKRKTLFIILGIIGAVVVIGLIIGLIVWIVAASQVGESESEGTETTVQDEAQEILDATDSLDDVTAFFDERINNATSDEEKVDLTIIEMSVYASNDGSQKVIDASERVEADTMTSEQRARYYGILINAYMALGDEETAYYYIGLLAQEGLLDTEVEG